ncbi:MAG: hypothetical protein ACYCZY_12980, partial [Lacisediminihabitans sp.]
MHHQFPKFLTLWAINGPLNLQHLFNDLDAFSRAGLEGVVFHPRFFPDEPTYLEVEYMRILSEVVLYAKRLGLEFWLYDENGWPSGGMNGRMLEMYPDLAQRWVALEPVPAERAIGSIEHAGQLWYLNEYLGSGVDYLNPALARKFLELTYDRYRLGLDPEAFAYLTGFFDDEPEFGLGHAHGFLPPGGAIPWTSALPGKFRERHGIEFLHAAPSIFFDTEDSRHTRILLWELLTDVFVSAFLRPLDAWCVENGKIFTAHMKGEETPLFQVPTIGSLAQLSRQFSLPGLDALGRLPGNNFYPREVSTASRQFGSGRCMAEAFGGAGWGATPQDLERYILWLGRNGCTDFVLHLSQFRLNSQAIRDWPPSQPLHLTWSGAYGQVIDTIRKQLTDSPRSTADTLLIAPQRAIMAHFQPAEFVATNIHNGKTHPDSAAAAINRGFLELVAELDCRGINYDVTDDRTIDESGKADGRVYRVGKVAYTAVLAGPHVSLDTGTAAAVRPYLRTIDSFPASSPSPMKSTKVTTSVHVRWTLASEPENALLLDVRQREAVYVAAIDLSAISDRAQRWLHFADGLSSLVANGMPLAFNVTRHGTRAELTSARGAGPIEIVFTVQQSDESAGAPFVWLKGNFRVKSATPYTALLGESATAGPFQLINHHDSLKYDLVEDGFPFVFETLTVETEISCSERIREIGFEG